MNADYDWDGCPKCPDCEVGMDCDSSNGRDTETMGGYSVKYYRCEQCKQHYELVSTGYDSDKLYPCSAG
jgi:hypothetical protein